MSFLVPDQTLKLRSQYNTFFDEDQIRFTQKTGRDDCKHTFGPWVTWWNWYTPKHIDLDEPAPERVKHVKYGRHCAGCGRWEYLSTKDSDPAFSHKIKRVRGGLELVLTQNKTSKSKVFFQAGMACPCKLENHMRNMTDDLMLSWFEKFKPKKAPQAERVRKPKPGQQPKGTKPSK